jgi:hypothetical protein
MMFLNFTAALRWKRSNVFARKVLMSGHSSVRGYLGYGSIFHLFSRTLDGQIEKGNRHNRRNHSFECICTRLVLLDFIFANREPEYLETEQDKVTFFCEKLNVAKGFLPGRVYEGGPGSRPTFCYFVDKFPTFLAPPLTASPPVVTLSDVDSGLGTIAGFLAHLAAYQSLFRQLQVFCFIYLSPTDAQFVTATERFRSLVKRLSPTCGAKSFGTSRSAIDSKNAITVCPSRRTPNF